MNVFIDELTHFFNSSIFIYSLSVVFFYGLLAICSFIAVSRFIKKEKFIDYEILKNSPIAPGISVIAPAFNESVTIIQNVKSLLTLNYANFEVIIVNDGSTDDTLEKLIEEFKMVHVDYAYDEKIVTKPVRRIFKSTDTAYANLIVVDKVNGKSKADASNAGINVATFNYFLCTDVDCILEKNTLLKMIYPFLAEEEHKVTEEGAPCEACGYVHVKEDRRQVIATGATLRIVNSSDVVDGVVVRMRPPKKLIPRFQELEYIRSYVLGKMGWSLLNCVPNVSGGLGLFDKEVAIKAGGYDPLSFGEDMDLITRMCAYMREKKSKYAIKYIPSTQCWTEGPTSLEVFGRQRSRWGRGLIQIMTLHRRLIFNPKYGRFGMVVMPYNLLFEFLAPIIEAAGFIYIIYVLIIGQMNIQFALILLLFIYLYSIMITSISIFWDQLVNRNYKTWREVLGLNLMAFLDPILYHPLIVYYGLKGYFNYITGKKHTWGNMQRQGFGNANIKKNN